MSKVFQQRLWDIEILKNVDNNKTIIKIILENDNDKVETVYLNLYSIGNIQSIIDNIINKTDVEYYFFMGHIFSYKNGTMCTKYAKVHSNNYKYWFKYGYTELRYEMNDKILKEVEISPEDALDLLYQLQEIHNNS